MKTKVRKLGIEHYRVDAPHDSVEIRYVRKGDEVTRTGWYVADDRRNPHASKKAAVEAAEAALISGVQIAMLQQPSRRMRCDRPNVPVVEAAVLAENQSLEIVGGVRTIVTHLKPQRWRAFNPTTGEEAPRQFSLRCYAINWIVLEGKARQGWEVEQVS